MNNFKEYNAMDIANYVIQQSIVTNKNVSNLFLLKILYYLQAYFLVSRNDMNKPLFTDCIQKWEYGPVVPSVYGYFKTFGASKIDHPLPYLVRDNSGKLSFVNPSVIKVDPNDAKSINFVFNKLYSKYGENPFSLMYKTHEEPMWKNYKYEIEVENVKNLTYSNEEIFQYFKGGKQWPW